MLIYKVTNKINNMSYIGKTIFDLDHRKNRHISATSCNKDNIYFHSALRKYGVDNFNWDVIEECNNIDDLNRLEIYYIGYYDTYNNGYNLTMGGDGSVGYELTESHKQKISEACKGIKRKPFSEKGKQNMSKARKGNKNAGKLIILTHPDGIEEKFGCIIDADRKYNLNATALSKVARGKRNHHKGYKCRYVETQFRMRARY